jgi:hypothetical protein
MKLKAFGNRIICRQGDFGKQVTESGIILQDNSQRSDGITARWFQVWEVGPEVDWLEPGEWLLVSHGRWTESFEYHDDRLPEPEKFWMIDPDGCLGKTDEKPNTLYYNPDTAFHG